MSKGDGSRSKSNYGSDVHTSVAKGDREKGLEVRTAKLGSLTEASQPERDKVKNTGSHLKGGNCPGVGKDIKGLLVVDIVSNIEEVPESKVSAHLDGLRHRTLWLLFSLGNGTASSGESKGGGRICTTLPDSVTSETENDVVRNRKQHDLQKIYLTKNLTNSFDNKIVKISCGTSTHHVHKQSDVTNIM
jgi:hypothetical protein